MLLSVIVPIYNVDQYLSRCLDSLLRQGLKAGEYEVICVNDGSPSHCGSILVDYARRYPDIFSIYGQENHGLSDARNTGMKVARGEWIAFVDSDDYLLDGGYARMCQQYLDESIDVLQFGFRYMHGLRPDQLGKESEPQPSSVIFEGGGHEAYNRVTVVNVWTKFYRRSFLQAHDIWFTPQAFEDELFNFTVFGHNPRTRAVSDNLYRYDTGDDASITRTRDPQRILRQLHDLLHNLHVLNDYLSSGKQEMRPGVLQRIEDTLELFYKKGTYVRLSRQQWHGIMSELRGMPFHTMRLQAPSALGVAVAVLKNLAGRFYLAYLLLFLYRKSK